MSLSQMSKATRAVASEASATHGAAERGGDRDSRGTEVASGPSSGYSLRDIPAVAPTDVAQLKKGEGKVPQNVQRHFGSVQAYHQFKQKNWGAIAKAYEEVYGHPPATVGAPFIIDAKVGARLIANLGGSSAGPAKAGRNDWKKAQKAASSDSDDGDSDSGDSDEHDGSDSDGDGSEHDDGDEDADAPAAASARPAPASARPAPARAEPSADDAVDAEPAHDEEAAAEASDAEAARPVAPAAAGAGNGAAAKPIRAYNSHADAHAKLTKNPGLGTQYRIKGSGDTVHDLSDNVRDEAPSGKKKRGK